MEAKKDSPFLALLRKGNAKQTKLGPSQTLSVAGAQHILDRAVEKARGGGLQSIYDDEPTAPKQSSAKTTQTLLSSPKKSKPSSKASTPSNKPRLMVLGNKEESIPVGDEEKREEEAEEVIEIKPAKVRPKRARQATLFESEDAFLLGPEKTKRVKREEEKHERAMEVEDGDDGEFDVQR